MHNTKSSIIFAHVTKRISMYKSISTDIKKIKLNTELYQLHKQGAVQTAFGMDNIPTLLDGGFGLYSTTNVKKKLEPIKTEYFRISLLSKYDASNLKFNTTMTTEQNKAIVRRMNKEFIEGGNFNTVQEIIADDFVNHTAPPGSPKNRDGVVYFFNHFLKPSFPDLTVEIHDMTAEGDKVTTRKSFYATHKGEFLGVQATNKPVVMDVIDIIQLRDGQFIGHWGILDMQGLMAQVTG